MHERSLVHAKRKNWTSLNFSFKLSTFYLVFILFTCIKTYVAKNASVEINLYTRLRRKIKEAPHRFNLTNKSPYLNLQK